MRVLVLGGTRFIGPPVVDALLAAGHEVALFHRGISDRKRRRRDVAHVIGDRKSLDDHAAALRATRPDVIVDMIAMTEQDARGVVELFRGLAGRVVAISSGDVYRAFGRVNGIEGGPVETGRLTEDAPLRTARFPYAQRAPDYDKILVEEQYLGEPSLPGTILRLPMVYGHGDYQHRFHQYIRRMDDRRPVILLEQVFARWRFARIYVDNVARAVAQAVDRPKAAGRVYNVAEPNTPTIAEAVAAIGNVVGWQGEIRTLPNEQCPPHLRSDAGRYEQHIDFDTTRIREELGYREAITREQALALTVVWEREHPPERVDRRQFDYEAEDRALGLEVE